MLKNLGPHAFCYGYPVPVLMVATYNDDGTVNVMNLHEAMRTNAGDLALCIGPRSKTHANVEKRKAFTVALVNQHLLAQVDYWGSVSGRNIPDKFERAGAVAVKSQFVNAPVIEGSPLVIECQLIEIVHCECRCRCLRPGSKRESGFPENRDDPVRSFRHQLCEPGTAGGNPLE